MKIKFKIILYYWALNSLLKLAIFLAIYFTAEKYIHKQFSDELQKRPLVAARYFLEKDEVSSQIFNKLRSEYFQKLDNEKEEIILLDSLDQKIARLFPELPASAIERFKSDTRFSFDSKNTYYSGIIYKDNGKDYAVIVSAKNPQGKSELHDLRNLLILLYILSDIVVLIFAVFFAKNLIRPLKNMVKEVNTIRVTNLHKRLNVRSKDRDELSELALTFNAMLDRLETSFEIQSNFINNASHELKNPLTAIMGQAEIVLLKERSKDEYIETLKNIETEANRLNDLINSLLKFAQTDYDEKGLSIKPIRIDELLFAVKKHIDLIHPENRVEIETGELPQDPDLLTIEGNLGLLSIALNNVIDNAIKFSANKKVSVKPVVSSTDVKIIVIDRGVGIPKNEVSNVFQPFYRGSNVRNTKGHGFGLSLTHKIVKMHGGQIEVFSEKGKGTMVTLQFPNKQERFKMTK